MSPPRNGVDANHRDDAPGRPRAYSPDDSRHRAVAASVADVLSHIDDDDQNEDDGQEEFPGRNPLDDPASHRPGGPHATALLDFKKTWLYANSRLPPHMMPLRLYISTWSIICIAAQASVDVYSDPGRKSTPPSATRQAARPAVHEDHIPADWRAGTKAMTIATRPIDDKNLLVVAIRGSQWNPVDWSVNFRPEPTAPTAFLDDEGNACHAGFLQVARASVAPIARRLRAALQDLATRSAAAAVAGGAARTPPQTSLIITGHSAGGAVASLLYMHLQATNIPPSELTSLRPSFRRIHCITFGTPPLSLLPMQNPPAATNNANKNLFFAFANEGDPVVRADRIYLRALTQILAAPPPTPVTVMTMPPGRATHPQPPSSSKPGFFFSSQRFGRRARKPSSSPSPRSSDARPAAHPLPPHYPLPPATLSVAGRMVLLRDVPGGDGEVEAVGVTDGELREVVFGDPAMHSMVLYKRRVERLAVRAVMGGGGGGREG